MSESDRFSDREHYFGPSVGLQIQNNIWCSPEIFLLFLPLCVHTHESITSLSSEEQIYWSSRCRQTRLATADGIGVRNNVMG